MATFASQVTTKMLAALLLALLVGGELTQAAALADTPRTEVGESRTFGRIRRLQAMILPVMFFFGVMKTLLVFLVAISLKTLFVGVSILVINVSIALAKAIAFFKYKGHGHPEPIGWHGGTDKNIHVHIHSDGLLPAHGFPVEFEHPAVHPQLHPPAPSATYGPYHRSDTVDPIYVPSSQSTFPKIYLPSRSRQTDIIYPQWQATNSRRRR